MMFRKMMMWAVTALLVVAVSAPVAFAAQDLPDNCRKDKGTITCTTIDKPGNSENGSGDPPPTAIVVDQTQGNTTNKSPEESQDLADNECTLGSPGLCKQAERQ